MRNNLSGAVGAVHTTLNRDVVSYFMFVSKRKFIKCLNYIKNIFNFKLSVIL